MSALQRATKLAKPAVVLLVVAVLAYGLLLPQMGFYWDELPMSWIRYELGPEAMTRYFSTNRPVWGMLYQVTTAVLPHEPVYWEVFALVMRWASAVLVWLLAAKLWPRHRTLGQTASLVFLLYPGFNQQWTSFLYSHFFIVLCFLLVSFLCSLWALDQTRWRLPLTALGLALSALNLWMMEYFYVLELLRPLLLWQALAIQYPEGSRVAHAVRTLRAWLPYVTVLGANLLWRQFVFNNQIYAPTLLVDLKDKTLTAVLELMRATGLQLYRAGIEAWGQVFVWPDITQQGPRSLILYALVVILTALVAGIGLLRKFVVDEAAPRPIWSPVCLGLVAMLLAGGPFLLTGIEVSTAYPANRFTLPFMLGVSLVLAGLLGFAPSAIRSSFAVALIALAAGRQALWAEEFRRDWITQKTMFWQMYWRAPGIEPNTLIMLNEGSLPYYADNSLTGAVNWIYDPDNRSAAMEYVLFYPTSRLGGSLTALEPGQPVEYDFISEVYSGSTSQVLAFYYSPPGCLRLLDADIDTTNHLIPDAGLMRQAAALSSDRWIETDKGARMPDIYGPEPAHGWCYYLSRAGLAAQQHEWHTVADLGDQAFSLDDHPNDPVERFVFIEGYAHMGAWDRALQLSADSYRVSRQYVGPLLCRLWSRIEDETPPSPESSLAFQQLESMLTCAGE